LVDVAARAGYDAVSLRLSPFRAGEAQHPMLIKGVYPALFRTVASDCSRTFERLAAEGAKDSSR
jgi:hypothetical protein